MNILIKERIDFTNEECDKVQEIWDRVSKGICPFTKGMLRGCDLGKCNICQADYKVNLAYVTECVEKGLPIYPFDYERFKKELGELK